MTSNCIICGKPLNESQWRNDKQYKSCPRCSNNNGKEHVYYEYPDAFGITEKRKTSNHPEGPQSYCVSCRGPRESSANKILCSQFAED